MSIDYNVIKNRSDLTDRLISKSGFSNEQLVHIFLRHLTYMEMRTPHPDRQEFWEYLEKIISEKKQDQMSLQMTEDNRDKTSLEIVDKVFESNGLDKG